MNPEVKTCTIGVPQLRLILYKFSELSVSKLNIHLSSTRTVLVGLGNFEIFSLPVFARQNGDCLER